MDIGPSQSWDDVCTDQFASQQSAPPMRVRIDPAVCIDHDDMMAGHEAPRRKDDDRRKRRWFEGSRDDRRGDPRISRRDDRDYRRSGPVDDIVRYKRPRDDDDGSVRRVRYSDRYDGPRQVAPKKNQGALWASLRNTGVGIGGIAGLGGGLLLSGMGVLNLMHNARTSPSMMMILGGAALAIAGYVALKTVFEEH